MDHESLAVLKVDDYMMRTYSNSLGQTVSLYIGWFKTQREGKTNHSPRQCLPGAGWEIIKASTIAVSVPDHGQIPVNQYLMENGGTKDLFLFWYQGRGRQTTSEYATKLYLIWDSITRHRTDGALIRLNSSVRSTPHNTLKAETAFIRSFYPFLAKFIPK
jgi:EpsI family protein